MTMHTIDPNEALATRNRQTGAAMRAMRQGVGVRQRDMASEIGVSPSSLSRYEQGKRALPLVIRYRFIYAIVDAIRAAHV